MALFINFITVGGFQTALILTHLLLSITAVSRPAVVDQVNRLIVGWAITSQVALLATPEAGAPRHWAPVGVSRAGPSRASTATGQAGLELSQPDGQLLQLLGQSTDRIRIAVLEGAAGAAANGHRGLGSGGSAALGT